jgi:hypothetical protein
MHQSKKVLSWSGARRGGCQDRLLRGLLVIIIRG